jgi:F420-non-reducing hydrogenase iron-sulfur subunit
LRAYPIDIGRRECYVMALHTMGCGERQGRPKGRPFFMVTTMKDAKEADKNVAIFFCRQIDPEQDANRRSLERERGSKIRFFPLPCSGRADALHFLKALEAGAEKIYLVTCPEGACRYGEGNLRAWKRLEYARGLLREVGFDDECLEIVAAPGGPPLSIDGIARQIVS